MKNKEYRQKKQNNKITMKKHRDVDFKTRNNVRGIN